MKVIAINGSQRKNGNTYTALEHMRPIFEKEGIEYEIIQIGNKPVRGCIGCGKCHDKGQCIFNDDILNEAREKLIQADGIIFGAPVYYAGIGGSMKCFMDRLFYTSSKNFNYKPMAAICSLRRSGGVETFNQMNNYFSLAKALVVPTSYWSAFHGFAPGEVAQDTEAMDCAEEIAINMSWLLKVLDVSDIPLPQSKPRRSMNFIR